MREGADQPGRPSEPGRSGGPPPGWYHDGLGTQRWWDGTAWTEHVDGQPGDPPPTSVTPAPVPVDEVTRVRRGPVQVPPLPVAPPGAGPAVDADLRWRRRRVLAGVAGGVLVTVVTLAVVLGLVLGGDDPDQVRADDRSGPADGADGRTAAEVVEDFTVALRTEDFVGACALFDARRQERLLSRARARTCDELTGGLPGVAEGVPEGVELEFTIGDVVQDGDRAAGVVRVVATYTGDDPAVRESIEGNSSDDLDVVLVREDEGWRVSRFR